MSDKANIYREVFVERQTAISNHLHLDPVHNNNINLLLDAGVIDGLVVRVIHGLDVMLRGARVVSYIIGVNNLDVYEKFLKIWSGIKPDAATEFEDLLTSRLEGYGMTRHEPG